MYYCRTKAQREVDFVVFGELGFRAIEVKNTATALRADLLIDDIQCLGRMSVP